MCKETREGQRVQTQLDEKTIVALEDRYRDDDIDEIRKRYQDNDREHFGPEYFEALRRVLVSRNSIPPKQQDPELSSIEHSALAFEGPVVRPWGLTILSFLLIAHGAFNILSLLPTLWLSNSDPIALLIALAFVSVIVLMIVSGTQILRGMTWGKRLFTNVVPIYIGMYAITGLLSDEAMSFGGIVTGITYYSLGLHVLSQPAAQRWFESQDGPGSMTCTHCHSELVLEDADRK